MNDELLKLYIRNRDEVIYSGEVSSITSVNDKGRFDVLPQHANFISLIRDYVIIRETDGKKREIKLDNAIIRVEKDEVEIFLGIKT